jgi:hypothetical protein
MGVLHFINGTPIDVLPLGLSLLLPGHALSISSITPSYTKGTLSFCSIVLAKLCLLGSLAFIISLVHAIQLMR